MKLLKYLFIIFILLFIISCNNEKQKTTNNNSQLDSIAYYLTSSENTKLKVSERKIFLQKALSITSKFNNDTLKSRQLSLIAYNFFELQDSIFFFKLNKKAQKISLKLKDTFGIADTHWSYGDYYLHNENYIKAYNHFNKAYTFFKKTNRTQESAMILRQMAIIKSRYRDYSGSETLLIKALKDFKKIKQYRLLYHSYNSLAILQSDIKNYDLSFSYYKKSLEYLSKAEIKKDYKAQSFNNIGLTYLKKEEYQKAITFFNKAKKESTNPERLFRSFVHTSYAKLMLNDTIGLEKDFFKALKVADSMNIKIYIIKCKKYISEFYGYQKDTTKAYQFAKSANSLAKKTRNNAYYLETLQSLSKYDKKNASKYLEKYIKYNDSLVDIERKTQNKFTRIEFETDEIKEESERLSQQQVWILTSSISLVLILSLIYFLRVQKAKNEKLILEAEQQKANEQVYVLTLKQQAILEEEKVQERNRISQELHDGVLGRLFGTRVGLGFLDISDDETTQEQHQTFLNELQDIEKEIRDVSHKLNNDFDSSEVNFKSIINQLLKEKSVIGNFKYNLDIDKNITWKNVNEIIKVNVYRIIQESLQNIIKHANATNVTLKFIEENNQLKIAIEDDGVGFNTSKSKKGIGLKNIKSRIKKINGTLGIFSEKNKGTTLQINILLT